MVNSVVYSRQNNADIRRVVYVPKYDAEVEYLQSSGTQYIDTGIIPNSEHKYEVTVSKTADNTAEVVPLGSWNAWQNAMFGSDIKNSTDGIYLLWGGGSHQTNIITNDWITLYGEKGLSKATLISTGEVLASRNFAGNFTCNQSAYLFALNCNGSVVYRGSCKISRAKIWNGDTLVRDFIPVRVGSVGYMYDKVSGQLFGNSGTGNFVLGQDVAKPIVKRCVMPIRVVKEVHVTFAQFPFRIVIDEVVYTHDINRRNISNRTPRNITYSGQSFPVWVWTEENSRGNETCFIGCEYFYPEYGSKLYIHSDTGTSTNGIFRNTKLTNYDFTKCWDVSDIKTIAYGFKGTPSNADYSALRYWKLKNCRSITESFSQLTSSNVEGFLRCYIDNESGTKPLFSWNTFYAVHTKFTTTEPLFSDWHVKVNYANIDATKIVNVGVKNVDMTNWDCTEFNSTNHIFYFPNEVLKIKTPILPLTVSTMKLPTTMYDADGNSYTEIPLNLDRQLELYKNISDIGKF